MRPADLRRFCLALPGATETVQWGEHHVFKVGGKMFAIVGMAGRTFDGLWFKVSPDSFYVLTREPGIIPAPYLARAGWVALDRLDRLPADHLKAYVARAHALIAAKLSKKTQAELAAGAPRRPKRAKARTAP
jgi:predicted DNA-binding protein (MmcQ/YjbR family)